jgi:hypothetical protein
MRIEQYLLNPRFAATSNCRRDKTLLLYPAVKPLIESMSSLDMPSWSARLVTFDNLETAGAVNV